MRRLLLFTISLLAFCGIGFNASAQEISYPEKEYSTQFKLIIQGIDKIEGEIRIAVFDSKKKYTKEPIHAIVLPVDSTIMVWKQDMPFGEYAIAVYHDKNKNGKIDTNLLGIPKENYGFSNNARGRFGPASWDDSKFKIEERIYSTEIIIK